MRSKATAVHALLTLLAAAVIVSPTTAGQPVPTEPKPPVPSAKQAQPAARSPEAAAGDEAFQAEDWEKAVDRYKAALEKGDTRPLVHFRLGYALHMLKRYDEALSHHLLAVQVGNPAIRIDAIYNCACAHALLGHQEKALEFLARAIDAGFKDAKQIESDTDLDSLRKNAAFTSLVESIGKAPRLHEQLDPLLGVWSTREGDVTQETPLREVRFSRPVASGQGILVTVTARGGSSWTGLLLPNHAERTWAWHAVDGIGTTMNLTGGSIANGFRFAGRLATAAGPGAHYRMTYTAADAAGDGSRKSLQETVELSDDGTTWRVLSAGTLESVGSTTASQGR